MIKEKLEPITTGIGEVVEEEEYKIVTKEKKVTACGMCGKILAVLKDVRNADEDAIKAYEATRKQYIRSFVSIDNIQFCLCDKCNALAIEKIYDTLKKLQKI